MPSRVWMSSFVSTCAAATAPLIFEEMRLGCIERVMTERPDATIDICINSAVRPHNEQDSRCQPSSTSAGVVGYFSATATTVASLISGESVEPRGE